MRIAVDAMGTDSAPVVEVAGAIAALDRDPDLHIVLVGPEDVVREALDEHPGTDRISVVHAPDRITSDDPPASALRRKPNSSIGVGLGLHKAGEVEAFVSAGSTGAVMAGSLFVLRRLPGVDRPTVGTQLLTSGGPTLMVDAGANIDCKPQQLLQFAQLGAIYMHDLLGIDNPRVGLLNVGKEPGKGTEMVLETYDLLKESALNFVGNIEGREVIHHQCDVLVCDGFTGNILLKFYESVAGFMVQLLRPKIAPSMMDDELEEVFRLLDYAEYGGAPLLGVNGVTIICHGDSPPKAITNAIGVAARAVRSSLVEHMARELASEVVPEVS